ncbi:MAG TPA: high-potential iron-sulfur protein [Steroidobacteraceae bacterium]|jgi:hypothetical protein|nr:high-potential iron-sulfur protein [Steroidobacteraceae bacterium]
MPELKSVSRRHVLQRLALAFPLTLLASSRGARGAPAPQPLLDATSPQASAVKYVEDAKQASGSPKGTCANCGLYQGANGSPQGGCQLFPGKDVKAAGWCAMWSPQM